MPKNLENSAVATGLEEVGFHSNLKERQCQRMFKLPHNCTHFTCQQNNAQNSSSQASTICELRTSRCLSWIQKRQRNQRSNCQHLWGHREIKRISENIYFCFIDYIKAFYCVDHNKLENSSRDGNTRPPYLPPEKSVCRSRNSNQNWTQNNREVPNWERNTSRLYIVTLFIKLLCRVQHVKCQAR